MGSVLEAAKRVALLRSVLRSGAQCAFQAFVEILFKKKALGVTCERTERYSYPTSLRIVSRSQTVTLAVTVWTTAVKRFVLSSPGSRVGDKWLLSASGTAKGMNRINPRRACAARVTVVVLCVCSVCMYVCMYVCLSEHAILAVRAVRSITKDAIVLSVRFAAILKRCFS